MRKQQEIIRRISCIRWLYLTCSVLFVLFNDIPLIILLVKSSPFDPTYTYYSQSFTVDDMMSYELDHQQQPETQPLQQQQEHRIRKNRYEDSNQDDDRTQSHNEISICNDLVQAPLYDITKQRYQDDESSYGSDSSISFIPFQSKNSKQVSQNRNNKNGWFNSDLDIDDIDDDDDDNQDDEDDDGHSSMLSTTFVARKHNNRILVSANSDLVSRDSRYDNNNHDTGSHNAYNTKRKKNLHGALISQQHQSKYTTTTTNNNNPISSSRTIHNGADAIAFSSRKRILNRSIRRKMFREILHQQQHRRIRHNDSKDYAIRRDVLLPNNVNQLRGGDSSSGSSSSSDLYVGTGIVHGGSHHHSISYGGNISTQKNDRRTNVMAQKLIVTAVVTLIFEGMIGHILEFLKIVMQTSSTSTSYMKVIQDITTSKGIFGLWDGFVPWGIVQALSKGAVFGLAHAITLKFLQPYLPNSIAQTIAGGVGGGFQGYVLSPTLLLKTRVMTNEVFREKMSALKTTLLSFQIGYDVVNQEGIIALMKGSNVFALKRVFDWSTRYYFSDTFEMIFKWLRNSSQLSAYDKSLASFLGGVASTCCTLPLDVLVAKTQDAKKAGVAVSAVQLFMDELNEKGWAGLQKAYMSGFEARLLHVCLTTVVIKTLTPIVYDLLYGAKNAEVTATTQTKSYNAKTVSPKREKKNRTKKATR